MTQKKKIIGLSCGRINGNSEILLKEALMGAEEIGVQSEIIRAMELRVKHCTGCEACSMAMARGKESRCAIKDDDVEWILQKKFFTEDQDKVKELIPKYVSYGNIIKP
jgi:multimeric flavodoxin WrbA